jgi:hypothetical protein
MCDETGGRDMIYKALLRGGKAATKHVKYGTA